jgi:hypothetical protein
VVVAGFLPLLLEFDPRVIGVVLNKVALGQSFLKVFRFSPLTVISPMLSSRTSIIDAI